MVNADRHDERKQRVGNDIRGIKSAAKPDLQKASREEIVELLLRSGLWPMIVQRPYGIIADPNDTPAFRRAAASG